MKILITGVCGFVGSSLARELRRYRNDVSITGIDNLSRPGSRENLDILRAEGIDAKHGDVRNKEDLEICGEIDWLIDAAANPSVQAGVDGKTGPADLLDHNLTGTIPMLERCRELGIPFTLLSTSRVYSIPKIRSISLTMNGKAFLPSPGQTISGLTNEGVTESFSTDPPLSLYGMSKRCSELLALEYSEAFGFPVWINRCGVLAGAGQFGKPDQGIYSFWLHSWRARRPLKYLGFNGHGYQVRDCLHPRDLAPLLWKQFDHGSANDKPRVTNVSGGMKSATSLAELSDWCQHNIGQHDVASDGGDRAYDLPWLVLDNSQAHSAWDWQPTIAVDSILREIDAHAVSRPDWLAISGAM